MPKGRPSRHDEVIAIFNENGGVMPLELIDQIGISRSTLSRLKQSGAIVKLASGIYCVPEFVERAHNDYTRKAQYAVCARDAFNTNPSVVCLHSAAHIHYLTNEEPTKVWVAVSKSRQNLMSQNFPIPMEILRMEDRLLSPDYGCSFIEKEGEYFWVTDPVRTVVDIIRLADHYKFRCELMVLAEEVTHRAYDKGITNEEILSMAAKIGRNTEKAVSLQLIKAPMIGRMNR
jgi:hypothetical protein